MMGLHTLTSGLTPPTVFGSATHPDALVPVKSRCIHLDTYLNRKRFTLIGPNVLENQEFTIFSTKDEVVRSLLH